jgi:AraC-like DNA-binding protein
MNMDTMVINNRSKIPAKAGWDPDRANRTVIDDHLRERQTYLKRGYRLSHLSAELGIPRHIVSQTINREYGMNFNSLINSMRIEHLKNGDLIAKRELYTLEAIAQSYGFSSRNSFIKNFKRICGSTPSAYFSQQRFQNSISVNRR